MQDCGFLKGITSSNLLEAMFLIQDQNNSLLEECFILDDIRRLLNDFHGFKCIFSPRATNKVAHVLAQKGFKSRATSGWLEDGLIWLSKLLEDDVAS